MNRDDNHPQNDQDFDESVLDDGQYQSGSDPNEWADQPVDDFADEQDMDLHADPENQEPAEEFQQLDGETGDVAPPNQKSEKAASGSGASSLARYIPFAGALAAIAVVGFLGWQQISGMMQGQAPAESADAFNNQQANNEPVNPDGTATLPPSGEVSAPVADGQQLASAPPMENAPPVVQPSPPPTEQPVAEQQPVAAPEAQILQPAPPAQPVTEAPAAPQGQVEAPSPLPQANDAQLANLNSQMEAMRANEARLNEQIRTLQQQLASAPAPASDNGAAQATIKNLEEKVATLEQQLEARKSMAAPAASSDEYGTPKKSREFKRTRTATASRKSSDGSSSSSSSRRSSDSEAVRLQREVNARLRASSPNLSAVNGPQGMRMPVSPTTDAAPVQATASWVLRSAQPGSAWLSLGGSNNLRRVAPGDKVQGLGTITAVRQIGGRWVVEGTMGSVR